jgi:hypothetical protein
MARVIYSKDNTQVMAVLPNGKEIRWIKDEGIIEQGVAEGEIEENLDANQKRAGQLGPTEKVKNNNIGKLVGESVNEGEVIQFPKRDAKPEQKKPQQPKTNNVKAISKDRPARISHNTVQGPAHSIWEDEITEEMIAKRLSDELALFKKGQRKDSELSKKPRDREIQKKAK